MVTPGRDGRVQAFPPLRCVTQVVRNGPARFQHEAPDHGTHGTWHRVTHSTVVGEIPNHQIAIFRSERLEPVQTGMGAGSGKMPVEVSMAEQKGTTSAV